MYTSCLQGSEADIAVIIGVRTGSLVAVGVRTEHLLVLGVRSN